MTLAHRRPDAGTRLLRWPWSARDTGAVLLPASTALFLGVLDSGRPQLWRDELASWSAASRSPTELFGLLSRVDAVHGAYYVLLHLWIGLFGTTPAALRFPSALATAATAALVVLTGRRLGTGGVAAWAAGTVFAVLPSTSLYAQQVRGYAAEVLFATAATWMLCRAAHGHRRGTWAAYAGFLTLAGAFHLVALMLLAPHALILLGRTRSRARRLATGFAVSGLLVLAALFPILMLGHDQTERQISWIRRPDLGSVPPLFTELFGAPWIGVLVLGATAVALLLPGGRRAALDALALAALPLVLVWLFSQGPTSYFIPRYLLLTVPAWCLAAASAVTGLPLRPTVAALLAVAVSLLGLEAQQQLRGEASRTYGDAGAAAAAISAGYRPGDGFAPQRGDLAFLMTDLAIRYQLPPGVRPADAFAGKDAVANHSYFPARCPVAAACVRGLRRLWVVTVGGPELWRQHWRKDQLEVMQQQFRPVRVTRVRGLTVTLLARDPAPTRRGPPRITRTAAPGGGFRPAP